MIEIRKGQTMGAMRVRHEPASAALVRHGLAADLLAHGVPPESVDEAVLVASELVGNAIRHAPVEQDHLDVHWSVDGETMTISVADRAPGRPRLRNAGIDEPSGRGLAIVDALSQEWGVDDADGDGKRVWARLALRPPRD